ncbi:MAG: cell wall metabolism sensor histidine kinase WalK [Lachnospiraceae bacterium]|nr:cell wall metabolism sensor histidine kinase WalK [Lachnospiraceae bacterium]
MKTIFHVFLNKLKALKSLRFFLVVLFFLAGILPAFVISESLLANYRTRAISSRITEAVDQSRILATRLDSEGYFLNPENDILNNEMNLLAGIYDGRIMITDNRFVIIRDTYDLSNGRTMISQEIIKCFSSGAVSSVYDQENEYIEICVPVNNIKSGDTEGVLFVSAATDMIRDNEDVLRRKLNIMLVTMAMLLFALALSVSYLLTRPFKRITAAISSVHEGFGDAQISIPDYTETEAIMNAFNNLMERLKTLDKSRDEFVSNVSHELKTPLTSMKVLADSLLSAEEVSNETYKEFMADIAEEVDREDKIITDLLSMVKMDKATEAVNTEDTDINELIETLLKRLRPIADRKNVQIVFESQRQVNAEVDRTKFTLAIMNLVENAIKYNKDNGWVRVELDSDHQFFTITVSDSGIGIPEDSMDQIFERFYRVDKSHSREIGGTGLGLAVTRSSILMHRGAIKVNSVEGEGTTFTVRVPLKYVAV